MALNTDMTWESLRDYLPAGHDPDPEFLGGILLAATQAAETFLNHDFDGEIVPWDVKVWILQRAARMYERRIEGVSAEAMGNVSTAYGPEEYDGLRPYRRNPGL